MPEEEEIKKDEELKKKWSNTKDKVEPLNRTRLTPNRTQIPIDRTNLPLNKLQASNSVPSTEEDSETTEEEAESEEKDEQTFLEKIIGKKEEYKGRIDKQKKKIEDHKEGLRRTGIAKKVHICHYCGAEIPYGLKRCPSCEHKLEEGEEWKESKYYASKWSYYAAAAGSTLLMFIIWSRYLTGPMDFLTDQVNYYVPHLTWLPALALFFGSFLASMQFYAKGFIKGIQWTLLVTFGLGFIQPVLLHGAVFLSGGALEETMDVDFICVINSMFSMDPTAMEACSKTDPDDPEYIKTQSMYRSLDVGFGAQVFDSRGRIRYEVPTAIATEVDGLEPFSFPFTITNVNTKLSGIVIKNLKVEGVRGYRNSIRDYNDPLFYFDEIDSCVIDPCELQPQESLTITASHVIGEFPLDMELEGGFENRIPCEVEDLRRIPFVIWLVFDHDVNHKRTLVIARSSEDRTAIMDLPDVKKSLEMSTPTAGPLDIVIDFNNPYVMGQRLSGDKIPLSITVYNKFEKFYRLLEDITITTDGTWPSWLSVEGEDCQLDLTNNRIIVNSAMGPDQDTGAKTKRFSCMLVIDGYPENNPYRSVTFTAHAEYKYFDFAESSSGAAEVDTYCCLNPEKCG